MRRENRDELRRLKRDFDRSDDRIASFDHYTFADYETARSAYQAWRTAIDRYGLDLLDALDAAEEERAALLKRAENAEALIRQHRRELWGDGPIGHRCDSELYRMSGLNA